MTEQFYYGIKLENDEVVSFIENGIPKDVLDFRKVKKTPESVIDLSNYYLKKYKESLKTDELHPGKVVIHDDGFAQHFGIILRKLVAKRLWQMVMVTSVPKVNFSNKKTPRPRRCTKDELALMGFVSSKPTYLRFAIRPETELYPKEQSFPLHRVASLFEEFYL